MPTGPLRYLPLPAVASTLEYLLTDPRLVLFRLGLGVRPGTAKHLDCLRPGRCERGWQATAAWLARLATAVGKRRRLILVHLPVLAEISRDRSLGVYDPGTARRRLARIARSLDIPLIDGAAAPGLGPGSYFPRDGHLNAAGHRAMADYLAARLRALGVVR